MATEIAMNLQGRISLLQPNITFVMIKADAIYNRVSNKIIDYIKEHNFNIIHSNYKNITNIPQERINLFYKEHVDKSYFGDLFTSIGWGARPMIVEYPFYDQHAWYKLRGLIGATNSRNAKPETIRGTFGGHRFNENAPMAANAIHGSDSLHSVLKEIKIIFPDLLEIGTADQGTFKLSNMIEY